MIVLGARKDPSLSAIDTALQLFFGHLCSMTLGISDWDSDASPPIELRLQHVVDGFREEDLVLKVQSTWTLSPNVKQIYLFR
jgi:hypothetical protein